MEGKEGLHPLLVMHGHIILFNLKIFTYLMVCFVYSLGYPVAASSVASGRILPSPAPCCVLYLLRSGGHGSSTVHSLAASWPRGEALLSRRVSWVWLIHLWGAVLAALQWCNKFYFTFLGLLLNSQVCLKNPKQRAIPHSPLNVDDRALWIAYMDTLPLNCSLMDILQFECHR